MYTEATSGVSVCSFHRGKGGLCCTAQFGNARLAAMDCQFCQRITLCKGGSFFFFFLQSKVCLLARSAVSACFCRYVCVAGFQSDGNQ